MKFSDLEYIALEGGGGKGAVYKGAIVALEKLCDTEWQEGRLLKMKEGELVMPPVSPLPEPANILTRPARPVSILDYYETAHSNRKIKGISGASAGAITAFPLALGLTSKDIDQILKTYPFNEQFLPNNDLHQGKYRMVGMDEGGHARILVAEDSLKKLGESKIEQYQFIEGRKVLIGRSYLKALVREFAVSTVLRIILLGLKSSLESLRNGLRRLKPDLDNVEFAVQAPKKSYTTELLNVLELFNETQLAWIAHGLTFIGKSFIKDHLRRFGLSPDRWKVLHLLPASNFVPAVTNVLWDRGIYSGFEVRDFFYKILLLALSKDTHFRRGWDLSSVTSAIASKAAIEKLKIKFNSKFEVETDDPTSKKILNDLRQLPEKLTFRELHKIIDLNLTVCVTNATTSQPLYFSPYFTPDYPVLEAVGASMNFPIAFKPTYNEANVLLNKDNAQPSFVDFSSSRINGEIYKETFTMSEYDEFLGVVLKHVRVQKGLQLSTNGNLSFRSFLPYLRRIIHEDQFDEHYRNLCYFYYNSAFKGLLIDGGVTNNLPVGIFTFETDEKGGKIQDLDIKQKVLALKLDNSFPLGMKAAAREILEDDKNGKGFFKEIDENHGWLKERVTQYAFAASVFKRLRLKGAFARNADLIKMPKAVWIKIGKELIDEYKRSRGGFTPWNKQVNAISGLLNALQFGLDQGQIENISDNENIIPLYCYGVGTLDFDLTSRELQPLVSLAVAESERQVTEYFAGR